MKRAKISIIGAGNIGGTTAHQVVARNLGDLVLYDVVGGLPQGKALDIAQSAPLHDSDSRIIGTNRFDDTEGSDVVVVSSGLPRKKGMSRSDLLNTNADIIRSVTQEVVERSPGAIIITGSGWCATTGAWWKRRPSIASPSTCTNPSRIPV